jgi:hypothetical protein
MDPNVAREFLRKAKAAQERAELMRQIASEHPAMSEEKVEIAAR